MSFNYLTLIYIGMIAVTRLILWLWPRHAPKIGTFQVHHYMYGIILCGLYLLIPNAVLAAIGTAFIVDELPLFFIFKGFNWPDDHWKQYHSWQSIVSIAAITVVGLLLLAKA